MDNEVRTHLDFSSRLPILNDEIPPQALSDSLLQSCFFQLNPQVETMIGLPMFSPLQGEPLEGLLIESNDVNNSGLSFLQQDFASESLRAVFPGIPTPLNGGFDGLLCDVNGRFLSQPDFNCRTSTSGFEPIRFSDNQDANDWVFPYPMNVGSSHPYEPPSAHNQLSLDLASCGPSQSRSLTRSGIESGSSGSNRLSLGFASSCRSPKFSTNISGSRYLGVLHQILSEIASFSLENVDHRSYSTTPVVSSNDFVNPRISYDGGDESLEDDGTFEARAESSYRRLELESKKSQLLGLLQMVDDRYNQCLDEVQSVTSTLHASAELDPEITASFALRTVSLYYKNLRERISNQILAMGEDCGSAREKERYLEKSFIQKQWALQQLKRRDQQLWRPQRGLPERSVSVLRAWMFDNFLHPYPKDSEKHLLAIKSGLTRSQVSNWFINARVRLWKPLVEEMSAELNRRKGRCQNEEGSNSGDTSQRQLTIYNNYNNQRFKT